MYGLFSTMVKRCLKNKNEIDLKFSKSQNFALTNVLSKQKKTGFGLEIGLWSSFSHLVLQIYF